MLVFTREKDTLPIVDIELAEHGVCLDKSVHSKTPDRELYPLINQTNYGECPKVFDANMDPRYTGIAIIDEVTLFE
jgi:hypothetical protein